MLAHRCCQSVDADRRIYIAKHLHVKAICYHRKVPRIVRNYLLRRVRRLFSFAAQHQPRLRRRGMYHTRTESHGQKIKRGVDRSQQVLGEGLYLVQKDNAAANAVQLTTATFVVSIEGLKKLDAGGHNHWGVPIFASLTAAVGLLIGVDVGVVLDHIALAQHIAKDLHCLLQNGGVRRDKDHSLKAFQCGVSQGKRKPAQCLASAGRNGQSECPRWKRCGS